jgi:hypothetical protein
MKAGELKKKKGIMKDEDKNRDTSGPEYKY